MSFRLEIERKNLSVRFSVLYFTSIYYIDSMFRALATKNVVLRPRVDQKCYVS